MDGRETWLPKRKSHLPVYPTVHLYQLPQTWTLVNNYNIATSKQIFNSFRLESLKTLKKKKKNLNSRPEETFCHYSLLFYQKIKANSVSIRNNFSGNTAHIPEVTIFICCYEFNIDKTACILHTMVTPHESTEHHSGFLCLQRINYHNIHKKMEQLFFVRTN